MPIQEQTQVQKVRDLFRHTFNTEPTISGVAPGRVNLIGEHTDYNEGFVFPAAIDREVWICAKETTEQSQLFSAERGASQPFDTKSVSPGDVSEWGAYGAGIAWALRKHTNQAPPNI